MRDRQLAKYPYCAKCGVYLGRKGVEAHVHHIERHEGDAEKFFNGQLESLCKKCHSSETAREVGWTA